MRRIDGRTAGVRLGQWKGVRLSIDGSLLVLVGTLVSGLAAVALPRWHPEWSTLTRLVSACGAGLLYVSSLAIHQLPCVWSARRRGLRVDGVILHAFGGLIRGERDELPAWKELGASMAGPLVSVSLGVVTLLGGLALTPEPIELPRSQAIAWAGPIPSMLLYLGIANLLIAAFNLTPGVPPDGGRVLRAMLRVTTGDIVRARHWAAVGGVLVGLTTMALGVLMFVGVDLPGVGRGLSGLWGVLSGWFIVHAARASAFRHEVEQTLEGFRARDVMREIDDLEIDGVSAEANVFDFVHNYALPAHEWTLPVFCAGDVIGLVSLPSARALDEGDWRKHQVREIMLPLSKVHSLRAEDDAGVALEGLSAQNVDQLPVVDNDRVLGLVRREDILHWLANHSEVLHREEPRG